MLPERMEDDGLVLRRWVAGDAEALHAAIAESASDRRGGAAADSGTDMVWRRTQRPQNLVLRLALELVPADRGGRRRPVRDGYRASMSFGRRRRDVEPVVHDAILVHEHGAELAPGRRGLARAWVLMPDMLPRFVSVGSVLALLEGDRIVGRAEVLAMCSDRTLRPLEDLHAAKTRRLT